MRDKHSISVMEPARAAQRSPEVPAWLPRAFLAVATAALLVISLRFHSTPLYGVESDLFGDLVPAARAIRAGKVSADNFQFKGPGYPLLLAASGGLLGGDDWLAARLLDVVSAAAGAAFAFLVALRFLGSAAALFVLAGLFLNAIWLRAGIEAGTDMPAFALSMAATWVCLSARSRVGWLAAGLLAAASYLTRASAAALLPAAALTFASARGPATRKPAAYDARAGVAPRWLPFALYAAGFALPAMAWSIAGRLLAGSAIASRNYLNVAYEIYGRGMSWDVFWTDAAGRFHSLADVLRFDPARAAQVLLTNAGLRWWRDARELVPIWLGLPAIAGMVLVWPRRPGAMALAAHYLFAYLVLATVFYSPRFLLYLVPFYLMGAAALLFHSLGPRPDESSARAKAPGVAPPRPPSAPRAAGRNATRRSVRESGRRPTAIALERVRWVVAIALLAASGWTAFGEVSKLIAEAPYEVRLGGEALRRIAPGGGRVMARKPQVAYFAGMEYVPLPQVESFHALFRAARDDRADYLFFSGLEAHLRPQFLLLEEPTLTLPGLVQVDHRIVTPEHFYVLYRFTHELIDSLRLHQALMAQAMALARANPGQAEVQCYAGALLVDAWRPREAIEYLDRAVRLDPTDRLAAALVALALYELGDFAGADRACDRALGLGPVAASIHAIHGVVRATQGRWPEACSSLESASRLEPTNPTLMFQLGLARLASGDAAAGRRALERCVEIEPALAPVRDRAVAAVANGGAAAAVSLIDRAEVLSLARGDLTRLEEVPTRVRMQGTPD